MRSRENHLCDRLIAGRAGLAWPAGPPRPRPEAVLDMVSRCAGLAPDEWQSGSVRSPGAVRARGAAAMVLRSVCGMSTIEIGPRIGVRSTATVQRLLTTGRVGISMAETVMAGLIGAAEREAARRP